MTFAANCSIGDGSSDDGDSSRDTDNDDGGSGESDGDNKYYYFVCLEQKHILSITADDSPNPAVRRDYYGDGSRHDDARAQQWQWEGVTMEMVAADGCCDDGNERLSHDNEGGMTSDGDG